MGRLAYETGDVKVNLSDFYTPKPSAIDSAGVGAYHLLIYWMKVTGVSRAATTSMDSVTSPSSS